MNNILFKPICELGKVVTGKTPSTEDESNFSTDFPFITPSDIHTFNEKKLCGTERGISLSAAKKMAKNILPADSVCFVCIGSTIGKMCMTTTNSFTNQQINTLIVNKKNNPHYIFYLLRYIKGYFQLLGSGTGSGKGIVNKSTFEKTKIPVVCDIDIQNRIADILSTYDDLIENNNHRIALLEKAAQELYNEWFVRFRFPGCENVKFENGLPEGWERTTFEKIASFQNGYAFKSNELLDSAEPNTYEVFKQGHIKRGGGFKAEGTKSWYHKSLCTGLQKFVLHKKDVLMAMTDMKDNVAILGNTAIMPYDNRYILNQRVGLLRPTHYRETDFAYIHLLTNSYDFVQDLRSRANRGVQVNLSAVQIRESETVVPSEIINKKFAEIMDPIFEEIFNIRRPL